MVDECRRSVEDQTFKRWEHLILRDTDYEGCAATVNALAKEARGEWLFIVADDDLLHPDCLQKHLDASVGADIVYGPPVVEGEDDAQFCGSPPNIPAVALIRTALWVKLGGYDQRLTATEDRDFYERAMRRGTFAKFARIADTTWTYRFHGSNKSRR